MDRQVKSVMVVDLREFYRDMELVLSRLEPDEFTDESEFDAEFRERATRALELSMRHWRAAMAIVACMGRADSELHTDSEFHGPDFYWR